MTLSSIGKYNRRLVEIRKAIRQRGLTPDGLLPIEGPLLVEEARRSGVEIAELFVREGEVFDIPAAKSFVLAAAVFRSIRATEVPQGVVALIRPPEFVLDRVLRPDAHLIVVLCGLQNPGNAGTVLRVAEAFGASGCLATRGTVSFYNDKLVRGAAGSLFRLPLARIEDLPDTLERLRSQGMRIVGTASDGSTRVGDLDWLTPSVVLFGNEGTGLRSEERALCDIMIRIPHSGAVDSLNAATAAAIVLYESARIRGLLGADRSPEGNR